MRNWKNLLAIVAGFGLVASSAWALGIGDDAPPLTIKQWIQGQPVEIAKGKDKNVYVVEFWATWCGPCRKSIPHINDLAKKYADKGLVVVGVTDEEGAIEKVQGFVKEYGDKMTYTVAVDSSRATTAAYMGGVGAQGIPTAFIVDKGGKLVWHGHPMDPEFDTTIEKVLAGKFDTAAAKAAAAKREEMQKQALEAQKSLVAYFEAVSSQSGAESAKELGEKAFKAVEGNAQMLNMFAWTILTDERVVKRDIPLALKAAEKANELTKGESWEVLDTYARALFDSDKAAEAATQQEKAVKLCDDATAKVDLAKTLAKYKAAAK